MVNHPNRGREAHQRRLAEALEQAVKAGHGNEPDLRTTLQAVDRYRNDMRFHGLVSHACAHAMNALPPDQYEFDRRDMSRALTDVCAFLLEGVLSGDAELNAMREERDHYKDLALESAALRPMPVFIPTTKPAAG
jgi:hypothetical protein